jgi:tetratricopeptide (TPR) repeat protein
MEGSPPAGTISPRAALLALALTLLTFLAFLPVLHCGFTDFDDPDYVTANPPVLQGLTPQSIHWAITATSPGYYQPLSWLSLMLDTTLSGPGPLGYHRTNLLLHACSAGIVFLVLSNMTGTVWRAFLVAALYALHPLRVESVAWIAERKDVLSNLLAWLALGGYVAYARSPGPRRYLLVLIPFALGLLAKPMIVTLPCLLLLLDYWPLGRSGFKRLLLEKLPLFAVATAAGAAAIISQHREQAMMSVARYTLLQRLGAAAIGYALYLRNTVWFGNLAPIYPLPLHWPAERITAAILAAALLTTITLLAFSQRRRRPWLLVGWVWFVGILLPVSGLLQSGQQLLADRFSYLPSVGLFIAIVWSIPAARWRQSILPAAAALSLLFLFTWRTCGYWQSGATLFTHALAVTDDNWVAHDQIAVGLYLKGDLKDAVAQCNTALAINPRDPAANFNVGLFLFSEGRKSEAIAQYRKVLAIRPDNWQVRTCLAQALQQTGDLQSAYDEYRIVLDQHPDYEPAHNDLGVLLAKIGMLDKAEAELHIAARLDPYDSSVGNNLAAVTAMQRQQRASADALH